MPVVSAPGLEVIRRALAATAFDDPRAGDMHAAVALVLAGEPADLHLCLIRRAEHPLERIMDIKEEAGHTVVTFTDAHLVHGIGEALRHAYHGKLDSRYTDEDDLLRVAWSR